MIKLQIVSINNYEYELRDNKNNTYKLSIEFYDLNQSPRINDHIFMSKELLDKNYVEYDNFYRFGKINSEYGRELNPNQDNIDVIGIKVGEEIIYLQRYYG